MPDQLRITFGEGVEISNSLEIEKTSRSSKMGRVKNITLKKQEQTEWCWAACIEMVLRHYGTHDSSQAEIVGNKLGKNCSIDPSNPLTCNKPCDVDEISATFEQSGIFARLESSAIKAERLTEEIDNDRPVEIGFVSSSQSGHVSLVVAWDQPLSGTLKFTVFDPLFSEEKEIEYDELKSRYRAGSWDYTWIEIAPLGS